MAISPYEPSGERAWALVPMALVGVATSILLALPYSLVVSFLFESANEKITGFWKLFGWGLLLLMTWVLGACGAGMIAGGSAGALGRALRARTGASRGVVLLACLIAATGIYTYYSTWVLQAQGESLLQVLPPAAIVAHLQEHLAGRATNGKVIALVCYGIEALFFLGGSWASLSLLLGRPYCEGCESWTQHLSAVARLDAPTGDALVELADKLREGEFELLIGRSKAGDEDERCLQIDFDLCLTCADSSYLTLRDAKHDPERELTTWEAALAIKSISSPRGIAGHFGAGFKEGVLEDDLVEYARVDEDFVRYFFPERTLG